MKLEKLTLHNFRSFVDQELNLHDYTLLVGANNSGKSTVIDAIRAFYEKDKFSFSESRDFPFAGGQDGESWVELTFQLSDEEHADIKDDYKKGDHKLTVRKYFKTSKKQDDAKTSCAGFIFAYKSDNSLSGEPFYGARNVQSGKFGELIFIPAVSKVDEYTKLSGPSALRDLVTDILTSVSENSPSYTILKNQFDVFMINIKTEKRDDGKSLTTFEDDLNELISGWGTNFSLTINPPSAEEIIKHLVEPTWKDERFGKEQDLVSFGSGFQRHCIYSLIEMRAKYVSKPAPKKKKDFTPDFTFLLFEEPEAFLHPPQQDNLARSLRTIGGEATRQVLCSTHSSYFVSRNAEDMQGIIRTRATEDGSIACQLSKHKWDIIVNSNQLINDIATKYSKLMAKLSTDDSKPEMESIKYFLWLNPDRASIFFADHVLLFEGPSEVALVRRLMDEGKLGFGKTGVYPLDCLGKFNIHRFMNLLSALGVEHSIVYDDDNNKDEHADINALIIASKDGQFTKGIKDIKGKLEDMLGVPPAGSDHRKPQHILYLYSENRIDEKKLEAFCSLVKDATGLSEKVKDKAIVATPTVSKAGEVACEFAVELAFEQHPE